MRADFENKLKGRGEGGKDIPFDVIDIRAYGMMDGKTVLAQADKLMGK